VRQQQPGGPAADDPHLCVHRAETTTGGARLLARRIRLPYIHGLPEQEDP
jgi:hypothetical protein